MTTAEYEGHTVAAWLWLDLELVVVVVQSSKKERGERSVKKLNTWLKALRRFVPLQAYEVPISWISEYGVVR